MNILKDWSKFEKTLLFGNIIVVSTIGIIFKADLLMVLDNYINNFYQKHTNNWYIKSEIFSILNLEDKLK